MGVLSDPQSDRFQYKLKIIDKDLFSKCDVLSLISKIFNPLGLIGPVVTRTKIFMQKLWLAKIDWKIIWLEWTDFVFIIPELKNLKILRYIF